MIEGGWLESDMANDTVKGVKAPCLLGSRLEKMASVGQECVNFFSISSEVLESPTKLRADD